jgi:hypothetical protein
MGGESEYIGTENNHPLYMWFLNYWFFTWLTKVSGLYVVLFYLFVMSVFHSIIIIASLLS